MAFEKGISGNPNGRPAGSKNKATGQLRNVITDFLENRFEGIVNDFESLEPKDRIKVFTDLLQYGLPKLQAVNVTNDIEKQLEALNDEQLEHLMNQILSNYSS